MLDALVKEKKTRGPRAAGKVQEDTLTFTKRLKVQLCGHSTKVRISKNCSPEFQPEMECTMYLVAEWISVKEMKASQSAYMLVSMKAGQKENEEIFV